MWFMKKGILLEIVLWMSEGVGYPFLRVIVNAVPVKGYVGYVDVVFPVRHRPYYAVAEPHVYVLVIRCPFASGEIPSAIVLSRSFLSDSVERS